MEAILWNNFIDKSVDDLYDFYSLSEVEQHAVVIYELYSESASGDGWEYFFDHFGNENISFDEVEKIVKNLFNDELKVNFKEAKKFYLEQGFDGDYDEINKPLFELEGYLEEFIKKFILENVELYK